MWIAQAWRSRESLNLLGCIEGFILDAVCLGFQMETALSGTGPWECVAQDCPQLLCKGEMALVLDQI